MRISDWSSDCALPIYGDPANDMPAIMQCLDAAYLLSGGGGARIVKARDFYEGAFFTKLPEGEILTAVTVPIPAAGHGYASEKLKRKIGDYAKAAAAGGDPMRGVEGKRG